MNFGLLFTIGLKIIEFILNKSRMHKEDVKSFMLFLRKSQRAPRASVRLSDMLKAQEGDILEQERRDNEKSVGGEPPS